MQDVGLCDEVESVSEFAYFGDSVSAGDGRVAAVTARARYYGLGLRSVVSSCMVEDFP